MVKEIGWHKKLVLGIQHVFAMFGPTVLAPAEAFRFFSASALRLSVLLRPWPARTATACRRPLAASSHRTLLGDGLAGVKIPIGNIRLEGIAVCWRTSSFISFSRMIRITTNHKARS